MTSRRTARRELRDAFSDYYTATLGLDNALTNAAVNDTLYTLNKGRLEVGKIGENDLLQSELALLRARFARRRGVRSRSHAGGAAARAGYRARIAARDHRADGHPGVRGRHRARRRAGHAQPRADGGPRDAERHGRPRGERGALRERHRRDGAGVDGPQPNWPGDGCGVPRPPRGAALQPPALHAARAVGRPQREHPGGSMSRRTAT